MAPRTWNIEVQADFMTQTQFKTMEDVVRTQAKILLTQAMLLADRRPPSVVVMTEDGFTESKEVMLVTVDDETAIDRECQRPEGAKSENAAWARSAGYTVADRDGGWRFNDPDGVWSAQTFATEAEAWEAAYAITQRGNDGQT